MAKKRKGVAKKRKGVARSKKKKIVGGRIHVVGDGQSLGRIAKRYNVSVDAIRAANDLRRGGRRIQPGDKLVIPPRPKKKRSKKKKARKTKRAGRKSRVAAK